MNGEVRIVLRNIEVDARKLVGSMILRQGLGNLRTFSQWLWPGNDECKLGVQFRRHC